MAATERYVSESTTTLSHKVQSLTGSQNLWDNISITINPTTLKLLESLTIWLENLNFSARTYRYKIGQLRIYKERLAFTYEFMYVQKIDEDYKRNKFNLLSLRNLLVQIIILVND